MPKLIKRPVLVKAAGNRPKIIEEFIGLVASRTAPVSIARMKSPPGWIEPGQTPKFDEYTVVVKGTLHVTTRNGTLKVKAGQAVIAPKGKWIRYSTPGSSGAEYVAVCIPAFSPRTVHRDEQ